MLLILSPFQDIVDMSLQFICSVEQDDSAGRIAHKEPEGKDDLTRLGYDVIINLFCIQVRSLPMATLLLDSLPSLKKVIWHQTPTNFASGFKTNLASDSLKPIFHQALKPICHQTP